MRDRGAQVGDRGSRSRPPRPRGSGRAASSSSDSSMIASMSGPRCFSSAAVLGAGRAAPCVAVGVVVAPRRAAGRRSPVTADPPRTGRYERLERSPNVRRHVAPRSPSKSARGASSWVTATARGMPTTAHSLPQRPGRGVDAVGRRDDEERGVRGPQAGPELADEVGVAGGVEEVEHHAARRDGRDGHWRDRVVARLAPGPVPGDARRRRACSNSVDLPAPLGPTRTTLRMLVRAGDGTGPGIDVTRPWRLH